MEAGGGTPSEGRRGDGVFREVREGTRRIESDARVLWQDVEDLGRRIGKAFLLGETVRAHPLGTLVGAAAAGFILGGGLTSRWVTRGLWAGLARLAIPVAKGALLDAFFRAGLAVVEARPSRKGQGMGGGEEGGFGGEGI